MRIFIIALLAAISYAQTVNETSVGEMTPCERLDTDFFPYLTNSANEFDIDNYELTQKHDADFSKWKCLNYASSKNGGKIQEVKGGVMLWHKAENKPKFVKASGTVVEFTGPCTKEHNGGKEFVVECPAIDSLKRGLTESSRVKWKLYFFVDLSPMPTMDPNTPPGKKHFHSLKSCKDRSEEIEVYYIRHGESEANKNCEGFPGFLNALGRCRGCMDAPSPHTGFVGKIYDAKLTEEGKKQAANVRTHLKTLLSNDFDNFLFVASPNRRAFGTLASGMKLALEGKTPEDVTGLIKIHPGLREMGAWCDVQSEVFQNMRNANHLKGSPSPTETQPAIDYLTELEFESKVANVLLDWDAFFPSEQAPWDMWMKGKTDRKMPRVFMSLVNAAIKYGKTKILIGAHSQTMKKAFAKYAKDGHLYCAADTTLKASNKRWEQLNGNKINNGAVLKFHMRLAGQDSVQMRFDPEFQFKDGDAQRCFMGETCAERDLAKLTSLSSDVSVAQQLPDQTPSWLEHTAVASSVSEPKSQLHPIGFPLFTFALGVFCTKIYEYASTKPNYHILLENEI